MATYYVDANSGSNSYAGSTSLPWKTIAYALTQINNGDTLKLKSGTFYETNLVLNKNNVTIEADTNAAPIIDGGYPITTFKRVYPDTTRQWSAILKIQGSGNTIDNIQFQNSEGRSVQITTTAAVGNIVQYCTSRGTASQSMVIDGGASDNVIQYCQVSLSSQKFSGGGIEIQGKSATGTNDILYCNVWNSAGEGIGTTNAENVIIRGNTIWDCRAGMINIDTSKVIVIEKNACFQTKAWANSSLYYAAGIVVSNEIYDHIDRITDDITVQNNIVVNAWKSMLLRTGWDYNNTGGLDTNAYAGYRDYTIVNNTFINPINENIHWNCAGLVVPNGHTACVFANNIIISDNGSNIVSFVNPVPSSDPTKCIAKWTFSNNLWSHTPGTYITSQDANQIIDTTPSLGTSSGTDYQSEIITSGDFDLRNYKLYSGSQAIEGGSATYAPADDYFGGTRPSSTYDDIGFHESGASTLVLVAGFSLSDSTPDIGDTVTHSDNTTTAGGASVERVLWTFADGTTSTASAPTKTYSDVGPKLVQYEVWDDTNGLYSMAYDDDAINVQSPAADSTAPLEVNVVNFTAGTATVAHGQTNTPSAIIFIMTEATASVNITTPTGIVSDAFMSIGIWGSSSGNQYWGACYEPDGQSARTGLSHGGSGSVLNNYWDSYSASVSSVDATNINLSWSGSTGSQQCSAIVFGGSAIVSAGAYQHTVSTTTTSVNQTSNANLLIIPTSLVASESWHAFMSVGFAAKNVGQACSAINLSRNGGPRVRVTDDYVAYHPYYDGGIEATFGSGQYTLTLSDLPSTSFTYKLATLAIETTGVDIEVDIGDTPTTDAATDTASAFNPAGGIFVPTNVTTIDSTIGTSNAGFFSVFFIDDSVNRTHGFHSKIGTISSSNLSDSGSYTDAGYAQIDSVATAGELMQGDVTLGTAKFTMDMDASASDGTARKFAYLLIEESGTTSDPQVWASYKNPDGITSGDVYAGESISFEGDYTLASGASVSTHAWNFGDTGTAATQDANHSYSSPGTYTVTYTVTDDSANSGVYSFDLTVLPAKPSVSFTEDGTSGSAPFTVEITPTITAGTGETIDYIEYWNTLNDPFGVDESLLLKTNSVTGATGTTVVELTMYYKSAYNLHIEVFYTSGVSYEYFYPNRYAVINPSDADTWAIATDLRGTGRSFVGPKEVTFSITKNGDTISSGLYSVAWDFDGGGTDSTAHSDTHEYPAASSVTSYTVTCTIYEKEGDTPVVLTETNFIYIYPSPDIPKTVTVLDSELDMLEWYLAL